jgi:hypothetical protein
LTISTLADLGEDLEVAMSKTSATLSEVGSLSSEVFVQCRVIDLGWGVRRRWVCLLECSLSALTVVNVRKKVEVVIKEV